MTCLGCKHGTVIEDSDGKYHTICTKVGSEYFLTPINLVFGACDKGEVEEDEE